MYNFNGVMLTILINRNTFADITHYYHMYSMYVTALYDYFWWLMKSCLCQTVQEWTSDFNL